MGTSVSDDEEEVGDRGVEEHVLVPLLLSVTSPTHTNLSRVGVTVRILEHVTDSYKEESSSRAGGGMVTQVALSDICSHKTSPSPRFPFLLQVSLILSSH